MLKYLLLCVFLSHLLTVQSQDTTRYKTGTIKSIGAIDDKGKSGIWKYFYPNGELLAEESHSRGNLHGEVTYYNDQGQLIGVENWNQGLLEDSASYFYGNGQVEKTGRYNNGQYIGIWKFYHKNGHHINNRNGCCF